MAITRQSECRKKDDVKIVITGWEGNKGQEVTVRYETAPQRKETSTWSWHEEFEVAWGETFITKGRKKNSRKGES